MSDEERRIHPDYQKYMDWVYWLRFYFQRGDMPFLSQCDDKTSEQIMDEVLSGDPLHTDFTFIGSFSTMLFQGVLIEPVFYRNFVDDDSLKGKIRGLLVQAEEMLVEIKRDEDKKGRQSGDISAYKVQIVGMDCEQPLESIQDEI
jgi:hypothetical protein